jgi:hypothetical protein
MRVIFPRLSGFCSKILEMLGAGLASAIGAFLLSQIVSKPEPMPPEPRMVQIVPADAETMRLVRSDQAALVAEIKKSEPQVPADTTVMPPPAPAAKAAAPALPKLVKSAPAVAAPREPKAEAVHPTPASYRAASVEPLPIQPATAAATLPVRPASQPVVQDADPHATALAEASAGGRFRILSALRQVPSWFLPDTDKLFGDAPRPPMPVGQLLSRAM